MVDIKVKLLLDNIQTYIILNLNTGANELGGTLKINVIY